MFKDHHDRSDPTAVVRIRRRRYRNVKPYSKCCWTKWIGLERPKVVARDVTVARAAMLSSTAASVELQESDTGATLLVEVEEEEEASRRNVDLEVELAGL
jgi:hypothetical protein